MNNFKTNFQPIFASTFESLTNEEGCLINQEDLSCYELNDKAIVILRTSKDAKENNRISLNEFGFELPTALSITMGNDNLSCLWISPDEFWITHSQFQRDLLWKRKNNLPDTMSLVDNSAAYGTLIFKGGKTNELLSRWMSYDLSTKLTTGKVASTTFGKAPIIIYQEKKNELTMLVRHSFSHYVAALLVDSAKRL
ncbi:MAG: sarcosine oxidase subunit gamma family protein [Gammaproteobacteria bacterium]|jgi:heterotetrameric sarcosine oxidase gamma subunit|nr:sarcosine oxidase subunit gamma family protein [Gammaproteobacteria bacterium]